MAVTKLFFVFLCACLAQISNGFFGQMFDPSTMMGPGGGFAGMMGGAAPEGEGGGPPSICNTAGCANYTVIRKTQTYELRRYDAMAVAVTTSSSRWMPQYSTFGRLRRYLKGKNSEALRMNMTYPTLSPQGVGSGKAMMMILPPENQATPPEPTSSRVITETLPAMDVYVRPHETSMFGSEPTEAIQQFKTALGPNITVSEVAFVADYNAPYMFFNRRAELWLVAEYPSGTPPPIPVSPGPTRGGMGPAVDGEPTEIAEPAF